MSNSDPLATNPVGRRGSPLEVPPQSHKFPVQLPPVTNTPTLIYGREYTGHAIDRMQGRGIPPSAVENAIQTGITRLGNRDGTTEYYDSINEITVQTDTQSGRVVTVW